MKNLSLLLFSVLLGTAVIAQQDKSKRPSPPATEKVTLKTGATVTIDYSQPSVKGRTIGTDLEPMAGKVWRTGANEATVFEVNKDVEVEGEKLPAGKYAFFTIMDDKGDWTLIFNKTWSQWGAFGYKEADDALRVKVDGEKGKFHEKLTFEVDPGGKITFYWGDLKVNFKVK